MAILNVFAWFKNEEGGEINRFAIGNPFKLGFRELPEKYPVVADGECSRVVQRFCVLSDGPRFCNLSFKDQYPSVLYLECSYITFGSICLQNRGIVINFASKFLNVLGQWKLVSICSFYDSTFNKSNSSTFFLLLLAQTARNFSRWALFSLYFCHISNLFSDWAPPLYTLDRAGQSSRGVRGVVQTE